MTRTPTELLKAYDGPVRVAIRMLRRSGQEARKLTPGNTGDTAAEVLAIELETILGEVMDALEVQKVEARKAKLKEAEAVTARQWDERWKK